MLAVLVAFPVVIWDLGIGDGGFRAYGDPGQWEWGPAGPGPNRAEPAWATTLDGLYLNDARDHLELPRVDLAGVERPVLVVHQWYAIAEGDRGRIEVDDGSGWRAVVPIYGYPRPEGFVGQADWHDVSVDLSDAGPDPAVRFTFEADASFADVGWYLGQVAVWDGDVTPPRGAVTLAPGPTQDLDGPYLTRIEAEDDVGVVAATLVFQVDGGPESRVQMAPRGPREWEGGIPGQDPDTSVVWWVEVSDGASLTRVPSSGPLGFRVYLAAPTGLASDAGPREVATSTLLSWVAPSSPHPVDGYQVVDLGAPSPPITTTSTQAIVPLRPDDQDFVVRAVYPVGIGDPSEVLSLDIEVPLLDEVAPAEVFQGDTARVRLAGQSLYLLDGVTEVDLGPGTAVESLEVHHVGEVVATLAVDDDAPVGTRPVTLIGSQGGFVFPERFTVRSADEAPRIVSVEPAIALQGATVALRITASQPFAGEVVLDPGADFLLPNGLVTDGSTTGGTLVVRSDAGIGPHSLVLDDGVRLWVADLTVEERSFDIDQRCRCAAAPGRGAWALPGLLAMVAAMRRGRRFGR